MVKNTAIMTWDLIGENEVLPGGEATAASAGPESNTDAPAILDVASSGIHQTSAIIAIPRSDR